MAGWNALFVVLALLLLAILGDAYFRLTRPFIDTEVRSVFVDGVGLIREPNAELRFANWRDDNFVVSRANSLGFLDREPISPERASDSCHIAFIGDSFVEARHVPIADKFHVRLEQMAARDLPRLAITTQAYGIRGTGQINQLPFYDEYARRLNPKVVTLVFYRNDFSDNSTALRALERGADPDRMPFMSAQRDEHGALKLRPPDPEYKQFMLPRLPKPWYVRARERLARISYFAKWMDAKNFWRYGFEPQLRAWADLLAERPCCALLSRGPSIYHSDFTEEVLPPALEDELEYTAFGIDQFKRRADRDDTTLIILAATGDMGTLGYPQFDRLSAIAEARGIPIISHYAYIVSQGYDESDGRWRNDDHWNAVGHQWVAEAFLEWLTENQDVCD